MIRRPPRSTRTDTLFPYTTLFRSAQLGKAVAPVAVGPDAHIPLFGIERRIDWDAARPRAVRLEDDALRLGGPGETVGRRIERWLKAQALERMERESRALAAAAGLTVGRSEEQPSELQSLMRISYAVFCLKK